jgi:hypothetical protein
VNADANFDAIGQAEKSRFGNKGGEAQDTSRVILFEEPQLSFFNRRHINARDKCLPGVESPFMFCAANRGEVIFSQILGKVIQPSPQNHHVSSGESQREFLRRRVFIVLALRVRFQRVINQLAGVKAPASVFIQVKFDAGAIPVGSFATIVVGSEHRQIKC